MKLTSTASLAVVALLMATAAPSFAQLSVDAGGGVNVGVDAGGNGDNGGISVGAGANAGANVETGGDSDRDSRLLGGLTAAIDSDAAVDISSIGDDDNLDFVLVSDASADVSAEFERYRSRDAARNSDVSGSVSANASLMTRLQAEGHDADDVVAITGNADGSFTVWLENN